MDGNVKGCAFIFDTNFHLHDQHCTLASLLQIPLIANDENTAELAKTNYPEVETRLWPDVEFRLKELADQFDVLFNCQYWEPSFKECFEPYFTKKCTSYFALTVNRIKAINLLC